jgi:predicted outer membrane protein
MTNRFMMSVAAAALIAGAGFANAQGTGTSREAPSAGSTAQQSAPSSAPSSATPMNRDSSDKGGPAAKTTQSD